MPNPKALERIRGRRRVLQYVGDGAVLQCPDVPDVEHPPTDHTAMLIFDNRLERLQRHSSGSSRDARGRRIEIDW
jgi:hypothetical protein